MHMFQRNVLIAICRLKITLILPFDLLQDWYYRVAGFPVQNLQGELALVTGGGGGLGRLISLRLSKLGVNIVIWDIKQEGTVTLVHTHTHTIFCSQPAQFYQLNYDIVKCQVIDRNALHLRL